MLYLGQLPLQEVNPTATNANAIITITFFILGELECYKIMQI